MSFPGSAAESTIVRSAAGSPLLPRIARLNLTESELAAVLPAEILATGRFYARNGCVEELKLLDGDYIKAKVRNHRGRNSSVDLQVNPPGSAPRFIAECNCGSYAGGRCEHVAAVLCSIARKATPSAPATADPAPDDQLPRPLAEWLDQVGLAAESADPHSAPVTWEDAPPCAPLPASPGDDILLYLLSSSEVDGRRKASLQAEVARLLRDGGVGRRRAVPLTWARHGLSAVTGPEDLQLAQYAAELDRTRKAPSRRRLTAALVRTALATGRCSWREEGVAERPLASGPPRSAGLAWIPQPSGAQRLEVAAWAPGIRILAFDPPFYVDLAEGLVGPLALGLPPDAAQPVLSGPPVFDGAGRRVREMFEGRAAGLGLPPSHEEVVVVERPCPPVPILRLRSAAGPAESAIGESALLTFAYGDAEIDPRSPEPAARSIDAGRLAFSRRDFDAENATIERLRKLGFGHVPGQASGMPLSLTGAEGSGWIGFLARDVGRLRGLGWQIEIDPGFRVRLVDGSGPWSAELAEGDAGGKWFSLDLGIEVEGERIPLLPLLVAALGRLEDLHDGEALVRLAVGDTFPVTLPDGRSLALPLARVRTILDVLVELAEPDCLGDDGRLRLARGQALAVAALERGAGVLVLGGEQLRVLADKLRDFSGIERVGPPAGLAAKLRSYQQAGLDWLQFLRRYDLSGILADDMGLGKTVQTIAHILVEKEAGRLDRPCLIVCPTSTIPNWRAELARFAPGLSVVTLHGGDRAQHFDSLSRTDVVLTTYALLVRDSDVLLPTRWHLAVLDEAQAIKNPVAQAAKTVRRFKARHRLCLTGTPVENHLGELWSQFEFLMPGLLGDRGRFGRLFRAPIEKRGDQRRQAALQARTRPFLLRRNKAEVATDLPRKSEFIQRVELSADQRDLYETVRLMVNDSVRQALAEKGLANSQIVILDALLKLRQVCCDPRLVKAEAARNVAENAKLEQLMEMLPELIESGRRVLLFSQFTGMLDLIRAEVEKSRIPFVELRGDTRDRAAPVARFQNGEVPLFLLSLKAGGTGLNLTAADTVIHYDPWWNPAAERQATDRAHRIGQTKPVFVYKLIATGTIEERILGLQKRKQTVADAVFGSGGGSGPALDQSDIARLLAPLEGETDEVFPPS